MRGASEELFGGRAQGLWVCGAIPDRICSPDIEPAEGEEKRQSRERPLGGGYKEVFLSFGTKRNLFFHFAFKKTAKESQGRPFGRP